MLISSSTIKEFFQRLQFVYGDARAKVPTYWSTIATEFPSVTKSNVYPFLTMAGQMREWIGPRVINNIAARGFEVDNKHWEFTIGVDADEFNDDSYGIYAQMLPMYAQAAAEFRDRELARVIEANGLCWDGQNFFDTDHPVDPDSGSTIQSNKLTGAPYDISGNSGDPLVAWNAVCAAMSTWKREDGQQGGVTPNVIMVHPNERIYALKLANAVMTAQAVGSAAAGVTNVFAGSVEVLVNPFLTVTSGKPWYALATNRGVKPFGWQNRQDVNLVQRTAVTDDNVYNLRRFEWGSDLRGAAVPLFPQFAFRCAAS